MPNYITSSDILQSVFKAEVSKALKNIADRVYEQLRNNIKGIYAKKESLSYKRTYDFFNAIIKPNLEKTKDGIAVTIGIDYTKIIPKVSENKHILNAHADINGNTTWNGISISEALLTWLDEGTSNSSIHNHPQSNYWYDVMGARGYNTNVETDYKKLDEIIDSEIRNCFSNIGIIKKSIKR